VLLELAKAYGRVGDVEGSPFVANLGNSQAAVSSYKEAVRTALEARARMPGEESATAVINAYQRLGRMEADLGHLPEATKDYEQSLALARELFDQKPTDPGRRRLLATNDFGLGEVHFNNREPDKALASFQSALQIFGDDLTGNEDHDMLLGRFHVRLGRTLNELGSNTEALPHYRRSVAIAEDLAGRTPPAKMGERTMFAAYNTIVGPLAGEELLNVGDVKGAQMYAQKSLTIAERLAAKDPKNAQAQMDLSFAYWVMGNAFRLTDPSAAAMWHRKSLAVTKEMGTSQEAQHLVAFRAETLASVLLDKAHAAERLQLMEEGHALRQKLAGTEPHDFQYRLQTMRSVCRLTDAALGAHELAKARRYAEEARSAIDEFTLTSPSLFVLRAIGQCYESFGQVQRAIAADRASPAEERQRAEGEARQWFQKSADVWNEWSRRGVATPESTMEQRRVERLLR
jgi:tetratricopeptide (TPR) repeat protein